MLKPKSSTYLRIKRTTGIGLTKTEFRKAIKQTREEDRKMFGKPIIPLSQMEAAKIHFHIYSDFLSK